MLERYFEVLAGATVSSVVTVEAEMSKLIAEIEELEGIEAEIRDASEVWGKGVHETIAHFKDEYGEKDLTVIPGPNSTAPADSISVDDDYLSWDLGFTFDINEDWSLFGRLANASRGPVTIGRFGFVSSGRIDAS